MEVITRIIIIIIIIIIITIIIVSAEPTSANRQKHP